jgi:putative transposase
MARQPRIEYEGAIYHIIARGNNRERIFKTIQDYELFCTVIDEAVGRFQLEIYSYCLMPNHYHLAVRTPGGNLSAAMAWIQTTFTARYKIKRKRVGHVFQGRYKSYLVESGDYLRTLIYYIHLNPIRTRKSGKLSYTGGHRELNQFRWSSHPFYEGKKAPGWLQLEPLKLWGRSRGEAVAEYRRSIKSLLNDEPLDWKDHLRHGLVAGGDEFVSFVKKKLSQKPILSRYSGQVDLKRITQSELRDKWGPYLEKVHDRRLQIWARVKFLGERPADLARELNYQDGSAITQIVKRVEQREKSDKKTRVQLEELRKEMSNVNGLLPK